MPNLDPDKVPEVKLDTGSAFIEAALTRNQRRGLFERPDMSVFAVVQLTSKSYTGHADGEDKDPAVKVRVTLAEVAQDDEQARLVAEVARAMMRRRKMQDTLDELGPGTHDAERAVAEALAAHPSEAEYEEHLAAKRAGSRIEQHG